MRRLLETSLLLDFNPHLCRHRALVSVGAGLLDVLPEQMDLDRRKAQGVQSWL